MWRKPMNTAGQNPSGRSRPAATDDLLLAEAMALTWQDYRGALVKAQPRADEVRVTTERISEAIRSDARLSAFADQPEFVDWAVHKVADDKTKNISEISADEVAAALNEPYGKLVAHLLDVRKKHADSSP